MILGFFDISGGEIFIILLVVFIFFGPDKIPEIARWVGKAVNEVKKATSEIRDEISKETEDIRKEAEGLKENINLKNLVKPDSKPANKIPKQENGTINSGDTKKEPQL